ncbi:hypothetical protein [Sphingobacterium sp. MYb382]|uniref:hypothetical protein n=1 Tax=Sphingobacterium sp. MYb382 TaxID=2745278 RepID=UPI0030A518AB
MKRLLSIGFTMLSTLVFSQQVISTEEYTNAFSNTYWTRVLGHDESGYYLLRESGPISTKTIILEKYSPALKLLFAKNIEATTGIWNDARYHKYTELSNGKVYIFLDGWNKEKQESSCYVQQVLDDGTLATDIKILETESASSQSKAPNYVISFSPDGSKLAVLTEKTYEKESKEKLRLKVYNSADLSPLWSKDLTLENAAERGPNNSLVVDNNGTTYLFKDIRISRKQHQYQVLAVGKDLYKVSPINLDGYAPVQNKIQIRDWKINYRGYPWAPRTKKYRLPSDMVL